MYPLKTQEATYGTTNRCQEEDAADGTSFAPFGPCRSTRQFPSSETEHSAINTGTESAPTRPKRERPYHKTIAIVFASRLVKKETIKGQTPMMLATTSTRCGILKSLVRMAFFRAGREDIQSRVSAPFNRLTINAVIASPSKLPNALEAVRCRRR